MRGNNLRRGIKASFKSLYQDRSKRSRSKVTGKGLMPIEDVCVSGEYAEYSGNRFVLVDQRQVLIALSGQKIDLELSGRGSGAFRCGRSCRRWRTASLALQRICGQDVLEVGHLWRCSSQECLVGSKSDMEKRECTGSLWATKTARM